MMSVESWMQLMLKIYAIIGDGDKVDILLRTFNIPSLLGEKSVF